MEQNEIAVAFYKRLGWVLAAVGVALFVFGLMTVGDGGGLIASMMAMMFGLAVATMHVLRTRDEMELVGGISGSLDRNFQMIGERLHLMDAHALQGVWEAMNHPDAVLPPEVAKVVAAMNEGYVLPMKDVDRIANHIDANKPAVWMKQ